MDGQISTKERASHDRVPTQALARVGEGNHGPASQAQLNQGQHHQGAGLVQRWRLSPSPRRSRWLQAVGL